MIPLFHLWNENRKYKINTDKYFKSGFNLWQGVLLPDPFKLEVAYTNPAKV